MSDAIVVGARCAGAPTAMLLAREGLRAATYHEVPPRTFTCFTGWPNLPMEGLLYRPVHGVVIGEVHT